MGFLDGTSPYPSVTISSGDASTVPQPNPTYAAWVHHDQALMSMIISPLSKEVLPLAMGRRTSRNVWDSIEQSLVFALRARFPPSPRPVAVYPARGPFGCRLHRESSGDS